MDLGFSWDGRCLCPNYVLYGEEFQLQLSESDCFEKFLLIFLSCTHKKIERGVYFQYNVFCIEARIEIF